MFRKIIKFSSLLLFLLPIVVNVGGLINAVTINIRYGFIFNQVPLYITQILFYTFIVVIIFIYFNSALKSWWLFLLTALTDLSLFSLSLTLFQRIYFFRWVEYPISDILSKSINTYVVQLIWIFIINFLAFVIFIIINSKKIKIIPSIIYILIALSFVIANFFVITFVTGIQAEGDCGSYYFIAPVGKIERGSCQGG